VTKRLERRALLGDALCRLEKQHRELNELENESALLKTENKLFRVAVERSGRELELLAS
jgi:hypothetical protein